jgi:hypothetical protein
MPSTFARSHRSSDHDPQRPPPAVQCRPPGLRRWADPILLTADRAKCKNLARDPWAPLHVTRDDFFAYVVLEGDVEFSPVAAEPDDAAVNELVEHHQALVGDHPNWNEYRAPVSRWHVRGRILRGGIGFCRGGRYRREGPEPRR